MKTLKKNKSMKLPRPTGVISIALTLSFVLFSCKKEEDPYDFTEDLLAYFPFNGNAVDEGPNQVQTEVTHAVLGTDRHGNSTSAYYFDGDGDYITIFEHEMLDFDSSTDSYTISFWLKSASPATGKSVRFLQKWNEIKETSYPLSYRLSGNGELGVALYDGSLGETSYHGNLWDDQWHHIVTTVDGVNKVIKTYTDGVLVDENPIGLSGTTKNDEDWQIGGAGPGLTAFFQGMFDDLAFHGRILNPQEIAVYANQ